jgi:thiosulfate sulfurtransferase
MYEAPRIGPVALHAKLHRGEPVVIVDVRSPVAFAKQHLPGARNIPDAALDQSASSLNPSQTIAIYCTCPHEHSSARAARTLHDLHGFHKLLVLEGGMGGWIAAGFKTTRQAPRPLL